MVEKAGHEDEVDWNGVLEPAERRRIHERIHSAFGAVGARIPDTVVSGGRKLRLKDVVLSYLDKEIALATKYLSGLQKKEALLTQQIDSLRASIAQESGTLSLQRERLAGRLRQMYMRGP